MIVFRQINHFTLCTFQYTFADAPGLPNVTDTLLIIGGGGAGNFESSPLESSADRFKETKEIN